MHRILGHQQSRPAKLGKIRMKAVHMGLPIDASEEELRRQQHFKRGLPLFVRCRLACPFGSSIYALPQSHLKLASSRFAWLRLAPSNMQLDKSASKKPVYHRRSLGKCLKTMGVGIFTANARVIENYCCCLHTHGVVRCCAERGS